MSKTYIMLVLACIPLCACGASEAQQQLYQARARRNAAIQQAVANGSLPASEIDYMHAHDAAFDQNMRDYTLSTALPVSIPVPSSSYALSTHPTESYSSVSPDSLAGSYYQPQPVTMDIGARGYDGRVYIPAGPDPNSPPNVMGR